VGGKNNKDTEDMLNWEVRIQEITFEQKKVTGGSQPAESKDNNEN
jgi:hypothetical protein